MTNSGAVLLNLDEEIRRLESQLSVLKATRKRRERELIDSWAPEAKLHEKYKRGTVYLRRDVVFDTPARMRSELGRYVRGVGWGDIVKVVDEVDLPKLRARILGEIQKEKNGEIDFDPSKMPGNLGRIVKVSEIFSAHCKMA